MDLKDVNETIYDLAQVGLLMGKKLVSGAFADEREVDPSLVSRLVGHLHPDRFQAKVAEIIEETESTKTLRLVPVDGSFPPFRAGQFVNVFLTIDKVKTSRAYSISSPPSRPGYIDITVRKMPDGFVSVYLCEKACVGETFELSGPAGCFYHEPITDTDDLVFLAGGSGITPFISMIRNAADLKLDLKMHVLYGCRTLDDVIFGDELADLACCKDNNLKVDIVVSEPGKGREGLCGFLDAPMISSQVGRLEGKTFFMCGPYAMYDLCLGALDSLGMPAGRVKRELSGPPPDITVVEGWPSKLKGNKEFALRIEGTRKKLSVKCGEPLLNSLERNRVAIDNLCRSGECGICRTRLVVGEVYMPPTATIRKADAVFGYIHPCMSYPTSDVTIRL